MAAIGRSNWSVINCTNTKGEPSFPLKPLPFKMEEEESVKKSEERNK